MDKKNAEQIIREMPKIELHLHLEGAFTYEFLFDLINKKGGDASIKSIEDLEQKFLFKDFEQFVRSWYWKNSFFMESEDFYSSAYSTFESLHNQNVIYAEVFFSPWDFSGSNVTVSEICEATISAVKKAENDFGIKVNLIADIVRDFGAENAIERLNDVTPFLGDKIIGIGLGGSEHKFPAELFEDVFREAEARGFHVVAHAGEAAGPESVWSALKKLKAERIGHGVRAVEDKNLVKYLLEKQIPLEVCITSNLKTKIYNDIHSHPFYEFYNIGLNVTVNSDDPAMFGATITDEFLLIYNQLNLGFDDIEKLTFNALNAAFIDHQEKDKLKNVIQAFWK